MSEEVPAGFKNTEIGVIPKEWHIEKIGDLFDVKQGKQISSKESKEGKKLRPFLRTSNVFWGKIDTTNIDEMPFFDDKFDELKLQKNDILVCEGGDVGRTALWREEIDECAYQNHLHRLRSKQKKIIDHVFFVFWMEFAIQQKRMYVSRANRTTIPNLSSSRLKSFEIPIPSFLEQQKIAHVLTAVQDAKEKTEAVITATQELKKSMMKYLFTYGPVPISEAPDVPLKETEIGMIPEEWELLRLDSIAKTFSGATPLRRNEEYYNNGNISWLKSGELNDGYIIKTEEFITEKAVEETSVKFVPKNTLLIAMYGATAGKVGFTTFETTINQAICAIIPKEDYFHSKFYYYWMQYHREILLRKRFGGAQQNLNQQIIKQMQVPFPTLVQQKCIALILETIDMKIKEEENKKNALDGLFKSMLINLMIGMIRVKDLDLDIGLEVQEEGLKMVDNHVGK
ncbi:MAG: restriction endonuclease subunit S [Candidatus Thermoplasmatota archaeon]|nr:restriction endonuclease subunit S [Candidatus Thermoplasmatota archaeon]